MNSFIRYKAYSYPLEMNFQFSHSPLLDGIITLHHDIFTYLLLTIISIAYLLVRIILSVTSNNNLIWLYSFSKLYFNTNNRIIKISNHRYYDLEIFLELIWTIIPMVILVLIGILTMSFLYNTSNYIYFPNYTICVTGHQWYWSYDYNDFNIQFDSYILLEKYLNIGEIRMLETDNRLLIPSQSHVRIFITSDDVIHSWAIPSIGIKLDASPGRMNHCHLFIRNIGIFYGQCSELCGIGHSFMPIVIQTIPIYLFNYIIHNCI